MAGSKKGVHSLSMVMQGPHVFLSIPLIVTHIPVVFLCLGFLKIIPRIANSEWKL